MLSALFWTLGSAGMAFGGIWIAALFLPSVAVLLKAALDFARSPLGMIIAVVAAGFFLFSSAWIAGDIHGTSGTRAAWHASDALKDAAALRLIEQNKAAAAALVEQNRIAAAADADKRIAAIDTIAKTLAEKVARYESEIKPGAGRRVLTGADIKWLQNIR
jgi:hypothetical protein